MTFTPQGLQDLMGQVDVAAATDETGYKQVWLAANGLQESRTPLELAVAGGLMAADFAQVFIAGYQAALRAVFSDTSFSGWAGFVVSEDRSEVDPLPGVVAALQDNRYSLNGYKSWVAAVNGIDELVVRARGDSAGYFLVARDANGLQLSVNPAPSMLPSLSQGRAALEDVAVGQEARLDDSQVPAFSAVEAFYIYVAFVAATWRMLRDVDAAQDCSDMLVMAAAIDPVVNADGSGKLKVDAVAFSELDHKVQQLRRQVGVDVFADNPDWQRDQTLIRMYSKGIQSRASN